MLAADARTLAPFVVSVWGNDFTLHAPTTPLMRHYTEWTMTVADGLHADCHRDIRLARQWGLAACTTYSCRSRIGRGSDGGVPRRQGGARGSGRYQRSRCARLCAHGYLPAGHTRRCSSRSRMPASLCVALADNREVTRTVVELGIEQAVQLLPHVQQPELADLFRRSQVMVSPSVHDGTPNSLLEGMACGCLPVAGDLESIREWIKDGENGLLVDATDPSPDRPRHPARAGRQKPAAACRRFQPATHSAAGRVWSVHAAGRRVLSRRSSQTRPPPQSPR